MEAEVCIKATVPTQNEWNGAKQYVVTESGLQMAYIEWGDMTSRPVILVHGYSDTSRAWSLIAPYLTGRRYIAIDLRGHGNTTKTKVGFDAITLSNDLAEFMDALDIQHADIVGHSMGSIVAGVFAAYFPEKVDKLLLISTSIKSPDGLMTWIWDNLDKETFPLSRDSEFIKNWTWNPSLIDKSFLNHLILENTTTPKSTWYEVLKAFEMLDWSLCAQRIKAETTIYWGDQDQLMIASSQPAVKAALPNANYIVYEGFGHSMFWEQPQACSRDMMAFLGTE